MRKSYTVNYTIMLRLVGRRALRRVRSTELSIALRSRSTASTAEKLTDFLHKDYEYITKTKYDEHQRQINGIRQMTIQMQNRVKNKKSPNNPMETPQKKEIRKEKDLKEKLHAEIQTNSTTSMEPSKQSEDPKASDALPNIYDALESPIVLASPTISLPKSISSRLGLALKYLVQKDNHNWPLVLEQLKLAGGFKDIPPIDVHTFVHKIPVPALKPLVQQVNSMMVDANISLSPAVVHTFMRAMSYGLSVDNNTVKVIERFAKKVGRKPKAQTYEILLEVYGKNTNMDKINQTLAEMKQAGISPSYKSYQNLLTTCVYKANDHKQAVELFDSMKFLSVKTQPKSRAYQDIIVSYVRHNDIEKALDIYTEMIHENIELTQKVLVALARGCSSRPLLRYKAWDFLFQIYARGWEPSLETYEYILYLSARDGDVALTRILYRKLHDSGSLTAKAFAFLLLSYSKSPLVVPKPTNEPLPIAMHESGRRFRRNILSDPDLGLDTNPPSLPMLPLPDLTTKPQLLAESSALWAHVLLTSPGFINEDCTNTFLNIAANTSSLDEFVSRFEQHTYLDTKGIVDTKITIEDPEEYVPKTEHNPNKSPMMQYLNKKLPRSTLTYVIALKAAGMAKNYQFAQKIWTERGRYRKSDLFKQLSKRKRDESDFMFASAMVGCLTKIGLLDDALAILISTEYQFRWTWKELNPLYAAAVEIGNDKVTSTVRGVAKRAQVNYEGKIRKKDYKQYLMQKK